MFWVYASLYISLCATKKGLTTGLEIPVKSSTFAFAELGAKCEVIRILKRHHYSKSSLHLTRFNVIITHITCSTFSLEGDVLVPLDTFTLLEWVSIPFRPPGRALKHKEESNSPIQRKNSRKDALTLWEALLKAAQKPKRSKEGLSSNRRDSKGGREAFHVKGCCDAFYLQYWRYWIQHLNTSTGAVHWQLCESLIRLGASIKQIWETINNDTFAKEFLLHLLSSECVLRNL